MSGLVLKLGPHERIMINGVVMENGDRRTRLNVLTPDANVLRLRVDSQQQVAESDEGNNAPTLTVNVRGSCGGAPGGRLRQAPSR